MRRSSAFTIVELLVVIAIIAISVAILLPAVQAARSAARKVQCSNNFKQVALGVLNHASATDHLPAIRDPRFVDVPRVRSVAFIGWRVTIRPYLEDQGVHQRFANPHDWRLDRAFARQSEPSVVSRPIVVPSYLCPAVPGTPGLDGSIRMISTIDGRIIADGFASSQGAASARIRDVTHPGGNPSAYHGAWAGTKRPASNNDAVVDSLDDRAKLRWITDGLSRTILRFEEAGRPYFIWSANKEYVEHPANPWIVDHHFAMNVRIDDVPFIDHPVGTKNSNHIFSFHPGGAYVSMCDGAVRFLSESVTAALVLAMATRANGDIAQLPD